MTTAAQKFIKIFIICFIIQTTVFSCNNLLFAQPSSELKIVSSEHNLLNSLFLANETDNQVIKLCLQRTNLKAQSLTLRSSEENSYRIVYNRYTALKYYFKYLLYDSVLLRQAFIDSAIVYSLNTNELIKAESDEITLLYLETVCNISANDNLHELLQQIQDSIYNEEESNTIFAIKLSQYDTSNYNNARSIPVDFPEFPWPPPASSGAKEIPAEFFSGAKTLIDAETKLKNALETCGYYDLSYYALPEGFALVSRLEQIDADGKPLPLPYRWKSTRAGLIELNLKSYFNALFFGVPGYYRVIVFLITTQPFSYNENENVSQTEAINWLRKGMNSLPNDYNDLKFTTQHKCTALIYEFEQAESETTGAINIPGNITAHEHLKSSGLWKQFVR